jgi:hypothetical protein
MRRVLFWVLETGMRWLARFRRRHGGSGGAGERQKPPSDIYPMW